MSEQAHKAGEQKKREALPLDEIKADMADGGRLTPSARLEQAERIQESARRQR